MTGKNINWVVAQPLIGGMPIGFENAFGTPPMAIITAGFSNDNHYIKYMNETRKLNIPIINMNADYDTFDTPADEKLFNIIKAKGVDVLMHVAVCAGLSQLNACSTGSKARGCADNDQNKNMYALTELGYQMGAKVVTFENAPAAYTNAGKATMERLEENAKAKDYSMQLFRTDTLLHGIPQSRKRTFIMFYRDGNPGLFNYEHKQYTPLAEYLEQVNDSMPHWNDNPTLHPLDSFYEFVLDHTKSKTFYEGMKKIAPEKSTFTALQLIQEIGFDEGIKWFSEKASAGETNDSHISYENGKRILEHCKNKVEMGKGYWDSSTYLANDGLYVNAVISKNIHRSLHPTQERGYNIRELLHLMGHPSDFEMIEPVKNWNQISQNVPVKTATFIGKQIKEYLDGNLSEASTSFVKQDNIKQQLDTLSHPKQEDW